MADRSSDVLVVGAGPSGLVASTLLARAGHRVTVLDDGSRPPAGPLLLSPPGIEVMREVGVLEELESLEGTAAHRRLALGAPHERQLLADCCQLLVAPRAPALEVLRQQALAAGAVLIPTYTAVVPVWVERRVTGVRARDASGDEWHLAAPVVVDASGSASFLPATLGRLMPRRGARRLRLAARHMSTAGSGPVLGVVDGSWLLLFPDGAVSAVLRQVGDSPPEELLRHCLEHLEGGSIGDVTDVTVLAHDVGGLPMATAGDGWVAVGEAAGRGAPGLPGATSAGLVVAASAAWEIDLAVRRGRPFGAGQVGATVTLARQASHLETLLDRALARAARVGDLAVAAGTPRRREVLGGMLAGAWTRAAGRLGRLLYLWWLDRHTRRTERARRPR